MALVGRAEDVDRKEVLAALRDAVLVVQKVVGQAVLKVVGQEVQKVAVPRDVDLVVQKVVVLVDRGAAPVVQAVIAADLKEDGLKGVEVAQGAIGWAM